MECKVRILVDFSISSIRAFRAPVVQQMLRRGPTWRRAARTPAPRSPLVRRYLPWDDRSPMADTWDASGLYLWFDAFLQVVPSVALRKFPSRARVVGGGRGPQPEHLTDGENRPTEVTHIGRPSALDLAHQRLILATAMTKLAQPAVHARWLHTLSVTNDWQSHYGLPSTGSPGDAWGTMP